jgi:hypothetical protein
LAEDEVKNEAANKAKDTMRCPGCQTEVREGQRYCYQCGAPLTIDAAQEQQELQKKNAESGELEEAGSNGSGEPAKETFLQEGFNPRLFALRGAGVGQTYMLGGELRLGRDRSNAIVLHDGKISRKHSLFRPRGGGWIIQDLDSTNGTYVNGVRIYQPVKLKDGDIIRVGDTHLSFHTSMASMISAQEAISDAPPQPSVSGYPYSFSAPSSLAYPGEMTTWLLLGCGAALVVLLVIAIAMVVGVLLGVAVM